MRTALCIRSRYSHYDGKNCREELAEELDNLMVRTLIAEPTAVEELILTSKAKVNATGFRYTQTGLKQILSACKCPGAYKAACDLAGLDNDVSHDLKAGIALVNRVIRLRYGPCIVGRIQVVSNVVAETIDGVTGARYKALDHRDFLDLVDDTLDPVGYKLQSGTLSGRKLSLRYISPVSWRDHEKAKWYFGLRLVNSEIAGEAAVTATPLWTRRKTGASIAGKIAGRVLHIGKDLETRVRLIASKMADTLQPGGPYSADQRALAWPRTAKEAAARSNEVGDIKARAKVVARLRMYGVPNRIAREALTRAIRFGSSPDGNHDEAEATPELLDLDVTTRTDWDLACALSECALAHYDSGRDAAEQAAYRLVYDPN